MARLSLTRTGNPEYSKGYLKSPAWHRRRRRWFYECRAQGMIPACQVCEMTDLQLGSLDLHHVNYDGLYRDTNNRNRWVAEEAHEDLVPFCRDCHQDLHRIMDHGKDFYGWDRDNATFAIAATLKRRLANDPHKQAQLQARAA